jgi:uncharacterized sulfatase
MKRRDFIKVAGLQVAALLTGHGAVRPKRAAGAEVAKKPNFLFILIDDMGWSDLPCYGNAFHETPNIDRLAQLGMRFTDAYAAGPVCSPTRGSILAGQYTARTGITDFIPGHWRPWAKLIVPENRLHLPLETTTLAEALKAHGYACGHIGKWHLGGKAHGPQQQGFENVTGGVRSRNDKGVTGFTNRAIKFIEENKETPFFLHLSHHTVHIPLEAPQELVEKYERKLVSAQRQAGAGPKPQTGVNNPVYAAMIEHLDDSTGRILKKLDELDLADSTMVVFFSDNGGLYKPYGGYGGDMSPVCSNAPLRAEKGTLYEGGIREPLIIRWPGVVKPGTTCSAAVCSVDFYPTFLQAAGAKPDSHHTLDGESLLPLLALVSAERAGAGQTGGLQRDAMFWHYPHYHHSTPAGAIRQGKWKLIEFFEDGRLELYNLESDIGEKQNLAKKMPERAAALQRKLAAWRQSVGAKMPIPNPDYDPAKAHEWRRRRRR